jgi:hypothetical protein
VKKLNISSRGWIMVALAGLILMFGAVKVVRDSQAGLPNPPADATEVPLNTLSDDPPPPMPGSSETPLMGGAGGMDSPADGGSGGGDTTSTTTAPPPLELPPPEADLTAAPATPAQQQPVVWVSEEGAYAYQQPGFNMPKLRELKKWEELQIVESTKEAWDRVRDEAGAEFWVQKKIVTVIRPQNLSQPSVAEEKVMAFYTDVAEGRHNDAYNMLSPDWKRELSYDDFVTGYARTDSLRSEITNVYQLGEDRYQVDVSMEAVEQGDPVDYLGIYTVEKVDGKWCLTTGSLKRQVRTL